MLPVGNLTPTMSVSGKVGFTFRLEMLILGTFFAVLHLTAATTTPNPAGAPNFTNLPFSMNFAEGQASGSFIYQVDADIPSGAGGIVFTINTTYPDTQLSSFQITSAGRLTSAAILDADVGAPVTYIILISVCDTFMTSSCNYDNLTLSVTEGNDPPVFTPSAVSMTLPENTTVGTILTKSWTINDIDGAFTFTYSLDASTVAPSYFSVNPATGAINISSPLDYENTAIFPNHEVVIVLHAADPLGLVGSCNLTIVMTDVNDCPPVFSTSTCTGNMAENSPIGTQLLTLDASDADITASFAEFNFTVKSPYDANFEVVRISTDIGNGTAALRSTQVIDRETITNLLGVSYLEVEVTDAAGLTSTLSCYVTVEDENEFEPVLQQSVYKYYIRYDAAVGTSVDRLVATDDDYTGRPLEYTGYNVPDGIIIGLYDGQVTVTGTLQQGATYSFTVNVTDRGLPPRSSNSAEVIIQTFDPIPFLTDWAIDTGGNYFGRAMEEQLVANIAATCHPCTPRVSSVFQSPTVSNHYVARVYITLGYANSTNPAQMLTTEQVLAIYTTGDGKTPTTSTATLGPGAYPVVSVQEAYSVNWWLDTPEGLATTCVLCVVGATLVAGVSALIAYKYWWKYRPEDRQYLDFKK